MADKTHMKSMRSGRDEQGFTLIELLVVMIIIGVLASIAVPAFLNQKRKAREASAKADVKQIVQEVVGFYVDGTGTLTLAAGSTNGTWQLKRGIEIIATGQLSGGNALSGHGTISSYDVFCVAVTPSETGTRTWRGDADGIASGDCT